VMPKVAAWMIRYFCVLKEKKNEGGSEEGSEGKRVSERKRVKGREWEELSEGKKEGAKRRKERKEVQTGVRKGVKRRKKLRDERMEDI
jgi:hypothetical protein